MDILTKSAITQIGGAESAALFKALASAPRLDILALLHGRAMSVTDLAAALGLSQSGVTRHLQCLEEACLVSSEFTRIGQATLKMCRLRTERIGVSFTDARSAQERIAEVDMPVGLYSRVTADPPCGLAGADGLIGQMDNRVAFLLPERAHAQLLWIGSGAVEYVFPNTVPAHADPHRLELSVEVCSASRHAELDYPSDITVWVNGIEIGTWTSPGDLADRPGRLNPSWWSETATQYGQLKVWSVDKECSYVDGAAALDRAIGDLSLRPGEPIVVRIGVKPDAAHAGGLTLFGRCFGNYPQDPVLRLHYTDHPQGRPGEGGTAGGFGAVDDNASGNAEGRAA